jgi:hypothetical protein
MTSAGGAELPLAELTQNCVNSARGSACCWQNAHAEQSLKRAACRSQSMWIYFFEGSREVIDREIEDDQCLRSTACHGRSLRRYMV